MLSVDTVRLDGIIEGCKEGKEDSQRHLYELYAKRMTAVCLRYTDDYETARDLMHDGFIKVFGHIGEYSGTGSFEGWLRRIFVNISLDHIRKRVENIDIDKVEYLLDQSDDDWEIDSDISIDDIFEAIKQLPEVARTIFNMFNLDGYSIKEICNELNMSSEAVRSQHCRAKEKLRKILKTKEQKLYNK